MSTFWKSLRVRLMTLVALGTIPALAFIVYSYRENSLLAERLFREKALQAADQLSTAAPILVDSTRHLLETLGKNPAFGFLDLETCERVLGASLGNGTRPLYADLGIIDLNGNIICSARSVSVRANLSDQHGFQQALKIRGFSSGIYRLPHASPQNLVGFSYPVIDEGGELRAVLFAVVEPAWLESLLGSSVLPAGSVMSIIDEEGTILGRSPDSEQWIGKKPLQAEIVRACLHKREGVVEAVGLNGIRKHYGIKPLSTSSPVGYVYAGIPVEAAKAQARSVLRYQLAWMIAAFGAGMALIWVAGYQFVVRQADIVLAAVRRLAEGDFTARTALRDNDGEIGGLGAALDKMAAQVQARESERDEAVEGLAKKRELLSLIIESLPGVFSVVDEEGRLRMWNKELEIASGLSSEEVPLINPFDFAAKANKEVVEKAFKTALENGGISLESDWVTPRGTVVSYYSSARVITIEGKKCLVSLAVDVTARKAAEAKVRQSEQMLKDILATSPIGIAILRDGEFVYGNTILQKMFKIDDLRLAVGTRLERYLAPEEREKAIQRAQDRALGKPVPSHYETIGQREDGETFDMGVWVSEIDYGGVPALLAFVIDISEMKSLRAQLYQAQKMEAIGTLAGGIAHDFNNILTVVTGYGELVLSDKTPDDPSYRDLQKICAAGRRGAELVRRLMTFSRKGETRLAPVNLNIRVEQANSFLERLIPKMIDIELLLAEDLYLVDADSTQMDQILINLAVNARDAMPRGGRLTIETKKVVLDAEYCRSRMDARQGPHVMLRVSDTGHGMDRETMDRIFEPFFTTKAPDKGTGLGLAMVFGIVKQHGGHITCESQPCKGTTFRIYFPVATTSPNHGRISDNDKSLQGSETILVVDDEEPCRELGERLLTLAGYQVMTATNGREALDFYSREKDRIELVLLDWIMPEIGGRQCYEELHKINPAIKVVITSGYTSPGTVAAAKEAGAKAFISKPYEVNELLNTVRRVLDSPS